MAAPTTRHLTILLTDIKGFTDKTSQKSRADIQRLLDDHRDVVLPVLQARGGRLVKTIGDAFLMVYDSPTDAVLSGVAAQDALAKHNADKGPEDRIDIRIAINAGEVNLVEGDVFGEPVNITARIEGVAEAGEVYFTEAVYLAMNKSEVPSAEVGLLQLKGIPEKIRVYKVRRETPLGVGQVPVKAAPAVSSGFAPGEKARFASAPAPIAASGEPVKWTRRALALGADAMLCSMLVGMLFGSRDGGGVRIKKQLESGSGKRSVTVGAGIGDAQPGIQITGDDGTKVAINEKGVKVTEGKKDAKTTPSVTAVDDDGAKLSITPAGVKVTTEDGEEVVIHEKDGWRVSAREGDHKRNLFPLGWFLYNFLFVWLLAGATPGKKLLRLRVVCEDGTPMDPKRAGLRAVMSLVSGSLMLLGYAWALWDKRRLTWHDSVAGTRVVRADG